MKISKRAVTDAEYQIITADFEKINHLYNVSNKSAPRINVTVENEDGVVGFVSGLMNHKWFFLTDLWISEAMRGKGLGSKILKMIEKDAKLQGSTNVYTWTTSYNSNDVFYEKQGYEKCLVLENYFDIPNGHHICLRKEL